MATAYQYVDQNKRKTWLVIFVFLIFIMVLGWVFSYVLGYYWIFPVAVAFAVIQALISYYYSDKITLAISQAKEVNEEENKELYRIVENLCITAGLPVPKIYIINDMAPNAFATGRNPDNAVICFTKGIIEKLDRSELEAVAAHELSHVGNYDIRLMTIVVVLVGIVALISDFFLRISFFGGRDRDRGQLGLILMIAGIILALLAPLIAMLLKLALSRSREYLADSDAVLLTRYPEGLANALEKISNDSNKLKSANKATAHLFITNPLKAKKGDFRGWFSGLFNTHPPIEERIRKLRNM